MSERIEYFDTHAHLDMDRFAADLPDVLRGARAAGVAMIVCPGIDADSSEAVVALAQRHEGVYAAVGIQPNSGAAARSGDWERIVEAVEHEKVVAIGESGLDRYWDDTPFDVQRRLFRQHLELARTRDLPIIIHSRDCDEETVDALEAFRGNEPIRGILHACGGSEYLAGSCLDLGLYVSFAGNVTYTNKKFAPIRNVARKIPSDRILVETDSPYLAPHPLRGKQKRNEPALVIHTGDSLAALRGVSPAELANQTTQNAKKVFRLG